MKDNRRVLLLALLCLFLYLPVLGNRDLWGTVETEYAQVARETLQSTSWEGWLIPHFNGSFYNEKPPLYFWLMALVSLPFGDVTEFSARLPSALAAMGTVIVLYYLGKALVSEQTGFLAALILLSSPEFFRSACMVRIDTPVAFFFTLSMAGFYMGLSSNRRLCLLGWFSAALCFLMKGPVYPFLIFLTLFAYTASRKELYRLKETLPVPGVVISLVTVSLWFVPAFFGAEPYLKGLFNWGVWYLKEKEYHVESFYFYVPQFLAGMAPWSIFIPLALYTHYKKKEGECRKSDDVLTMTLPWLLVGLTAFSLISTKHSRYILFLYPAGALMVAMIWECYWARSSPLRSWQRSLPVFLVAVFVGLVVAFFFGKRLPYPVLGLSLAGAAMLITAYLTSRALQMRLLFGAILLTLIAYQVAYYNFLLPLQNESHSERALCQDIINAMEPGSKWIAFRVYRPSFTYYTRTFPRNVHGKEELEALLSSRERVYCLLEEEELRDLKTTVFKVSEFPNHRGKGPALILVSNKPRVLE